VIQQNNAVVMRVRLDGIKGEQPNLYWRGVALDTFDGQYWERSDRTSKTYPKSDRDLIPLDLATSRESLVAQTIYLEPLDTSVLFGLPKIVGIQTGLPAVYKDSDGGIGAIRPTERISYRIFSDRSLPSVEELRTDNQKYPDSADRFLELPSDLDNRISQLASNIAAGKTNRYDKAKAIEQYLQTNFGYTLEMKAGGKDPLADFLFNVREGHCEYFATAMTIMLRTQGIASRVVNGFHQGDYNETADIYVVRQRHAHSWVEAYFPKSDAWIRFDPTPPADQAAPGFSSGFSGRINKYLDALETYWIQYFVAYDNQEQRSLAKTVREGLFNYEHNIASLTSSAQAVINRWWSELRGDYGSEVRMRAMGSTVLYIAIFVVGALLFGWVARKIVKLKVWRRVADWLRNRKQPSVVEFYGRMLGILASKGFVRQPHQTPLEFAYAVRLSEAVSVTEKYNRVRFGEIDLSRAEEEVIEGWLKALTATNVHERTRSS
jgi:transglutaminase-like putative cysteine protease